ncbi:ATP-binding protein [Citrobacter sp. Cpo137]|uniref:AVAST type 4 anti-phage nuclease Avs4 n=1 Tax=Citrobacter TaxID=544 RepID=UPI0023B2AAF8|nr:MULTISPECIES: AVAST type 4 anti-phage nuclease Avs4 [Citrobacter]MDE9680158.1 ATP-binding protein [Citrobacter portucalensis]MDM2780897.1 ATP-binding protein [Citrobacter sp. Cpo137]
MVKPNWDNFKAKFNENPQDNFEWFCYLLFCQEFKIPAGIFRYKNQSGIETNPITKDNELIGWQAKFYDTKLSDNKADLIEMIGKSKKAYPGLSKIIFYTNQEWGQGRKSHEPEDEKSADNYLENIGNSNDPKIKIEVDQKAYESGIEIVWRVASFFESPFVIVENEKIAKHFFSLNESIFDLLEEKRKHTENVLYEIQTNIDFKDRSIEIDRRHCIEILYENLVQKKIVIVSGEGGVGKTAVIKKIYEAEKQCTPFYVFKASEFKKDSINELFGAHGLDDFSNAHQDELRKVIVVDSAEKLLELTNIDPFKEFLTVLIKDKWQIVFTTRNNYLSDLNYAFIDIYKITPENLVIKNLERSELIELSDNNGFSLPQDVRLLELIKNPFYLSEYLRFYTDESIDYVSFKEKLWNKIIVKNKPSREQCFLATAFQRASEGQFFVSPACDTKILDALVKDGVIGYEAAGYFITHDIYEEWALEKKISVDYIRKANNNEFFEKIGESLPVRRSFRNWISERLLLDDQTLKPFIAEIVCGEGISKFWKDELWIAVLLSDNSDMFFNFFKRYLLGNDQNLLKRLTFLLRLACKDVDYDLLRQLGVSNSDLLSIKYVLTKPKGTGWHSVIKLIHENLDEIGVRNINFILPVIQEWNQKNKVGETTRLSSLIALKYYQWTVEEDVYLSGRGNEKNILHAILHGAAMIKPEIEEVLVKVLKNRWNEHGTPYFDLMTLILTDLDSHPVWAYLPEYVLQLADLFWYRPLKEKGERYHRMDIEDEFGLFRSHHDYYPESPYQTPIYWLLQLQFKKTIDFILDFTNKTTVCFAHSRFAKNEVEEVEVFIEDGKLIKQYICNRLWCSYRGTQVSAYLLSSIHMALEKFFLEKFKNADSKVLESWLLYLLRNSKSASISAVVTSIVLAFPEKSFNVAKVLFQTKAFFHFDMNRMILDKTHKSSLISLRNSFGGANYKNTLHEEDRIKACDDVHRNNYLENLALHYQIFRSENITEEVVKERQQVLWDIFDKYYSQFPDESQETEVDKTWRLCLARMDRRKMKITTKEKDEGIEILFNPEIDPKLKQYSDEAIKKNSEHMKYMTLKLWVSYKRDKDERHKLYEMYENKPQVVLQETKEIMCKLNENSDDDFRLLNSNIPADVCSILLLEHFNELAYEEREYCKDIVLAYSKLPLSDGYNYQALDGTTSAISALSVVYHNYPMERDTIKIILLLTLFNDYPTGMLGGRYSVFPSMVIHKLWKDYFDDMQSLLFGFLILKPKHVALGREIIHERYRQGDYDIKKTNLNERFLNDYGQCISNVIGNKISIDHLGDMEKVELHILNTAFHLIPINTVNIEHKQLVSLIVKHFSTSLLSSDREDRVDCAVRHSFLERFAYFTLHTSASELPDYLKPFLDGFNGSEPIAELFKEFILAEDQLNTYAKFWQVWDLFFDKVVTLCKDGDRYWYVDKILKSYLFAETSWKENSNGWHTFKDSNSQFFSDVSKTMGHCPSTLYSLAKSLNNIAGCYLNQGITWLSGILSANKELCEKKLENDTVYYLECLVRRYINTERERIRRTKQLREEVLVILEFLVEKGSVVGYMSRENIL